MPPAATIGPPPPSTADSNRAMDDRQSAKGLILIFVYVAVAIGSLSALAILPGKTRHSNSPWYRALLCLSMFTWAVSFTLLVGNLAMRFRKNSVFAPNATTYVMKGSGFKSNSQVAPLAATPLFLSEDATPAATLGPPPPATADSNQAMDDRKSTKGLVLIFVHAVVAIGSLSALTILPGKTRHSNSPWYRVLLCLSMFTWAVSFTLLVGNLAVRFRNNSIAAPKATTCICKERAGFQE